MTAFAFQLAGLPGAFHKKISFVVCFVVCVVSFRQIAFLAFVGEELSVYRKTRQRSSDSSHLLCSFF